MARSHILSAVKFLSVDLVGAILYYPLWWYSKGMARTAGWCVGKLRNAAASFAIGVWIRNLFTPMFGQYDAASRIISFFMRLAAIVWYTLVLAILLVILVFVFLLWLAVPVFVVVMFVTQLMGVLGST